LFLTSIGYGSFSFFALVSADLATFSAEPLAAFVSWYFGDSSKRAFPA
jgi:hypothetical protein